MVSTLLLLVTLSAAPVATGPALASQLGDGSAQLRWDAHGHLRAASGQLGVLRPGAAGVEAFLRERAAALGLRADEGLRVVADVRDALGHRHVKVARTLAGIPVAFDQLRIHADAAGSVYVLEAELSSLQGFAHAAPRLSPWKAIALAGGGRASKLTEPATASLVILGNAMDGIFAPHLAYRVHLAFPARPGKVPVIEDVYVDAQSGARLLRLSQVFTATAATMQTLDLYGHTVTVDVTDNGSQGIGLVDVVTLAQGGQAYTLDGAHHNNLFVTSSTATPFSDAQAGSVASNLKTTVDYYKTNYGWTQWNFNTQPSTPGGILAGIAHTGVDLANAYFATATSNGSVIGTMNYGDGDGQNLIQTARCLDVTGHEMGHGVVTGTAQLAYHNQSGALNESFADVFGWLLDQRNDTIGEDCVGPNLRPALRDMCTPDSDALAQPQPAKMSDYQTLPDTEDGDSGGVHENSGIPNHAACLARNGITAAGGAGPDEVGKIWFRALSQHLGATATFADMVQATATACTELGYAASHCAALQSAWVQVGLATSSSSGTCPPHSSAQSGGCTCDAGYQPNAASTGCDPVASVSCPAHAHASSGQCYCDGGYSPSADGTSCVPDTAASCPSNSHQEGGSCTCDTCYQGSPTGDSGGCTPTPGCNASCTNPASTADASCSCIPGLSKDASGKCTVPTAGQCGAETYAGRCVGQVLIYCDNTQGAATQEVAVLDCGASGNACGVDPGGNGYNCVTVQDGCGGVPETGTCPSATTAQYCDSGVLKTVDCGSAGCVDFTYQGADYQYCNPCTAHASYSSADEKCHCDPGYGISADGQSCVAESGGTTTTGGGGSGDGGCGSTGGGAFSLLGLLGLGLIAIRRKR